MLARLIWLWMGLRFIAGTTDFSLIQSRQTGQQILNCVVWGEYSDGSVKLTISFIYSLG